jgi:hypothetical protein
MEENGRAFRCKPCRQILIFYPVAAGSAFWPDAVALADVPHSVVGIQQSNVTAQREH